MQVADSVVRGASQAVHKLAKSGQLAQDERPRGPQRELHRKEANEGAVLPYVCDAGAAVQIGEHSDRHDGTGEEVVSKEDALFDVT